MACRLDTIYPDALNFCIEKSGARTALARLPAVNDCSEQGSQNVPCEDNWNNSLCGNNKPYFRPLSPGEPLQIQTNFIDTRNFDSQNVECNGTNPNRVRARFRVDFTGNNWRQQAMQTVPDPNRAGQFIDVHVGGYHSLLGDCNPFAGLSIGTEFSNGTIGGNTFADFISGWVAATNAYDANTRPLCSENTGFGVSWSFEANGNNGGWISYEGDLCEISAWLNCPNVTSADELCAEKNCCDCTFPNVPDITQAYIQPCFAWMNGGNSTGLVPTAVDFITIQLQEYTACCNEPIECVGFGDADCDFDENLARFEITIPDNPAYVFGAAAQELAGVTDTGFVLEFINPLPCANYVWADVPELLKFSNATDYANYMANVLSWFQGLIAGWGVSSVSLIGGQTIELFIDRLFFEGTLGIDACRGEYTICPITGPDTTQCLLTAPYRISFEVERVPINSIEPGPFSIWLVCGGVRYAEYTMNSFDLENWANFINSSVPGISLLLDDLAQGNAVISRMEFSIDLAAYPALAQCLQGGGQIDIFASSPSFVVAPNTILDDGDGCAQACAQTIQDYTSYDILLTNYISNNPGLADPTTGGFFEYDIQFFCWDYANPRTPAQVYQQGFSSILITSGMAADKLRTLVADFNARANNEFGFNLFFEIVNTDRLRLHVPDAYLASIGCVCDNQTNAFVAHLSLKFNPGTPNEFIDTIGLATRFCCDNDCLVPPNLSRTTISFVDDGYIYGDPSNDSCFSLGNSFSPCIPGDCDNTPNLICLSEAASFQDFIAIAIQRMMAQYPGSSIYWNGTEFVAWIPREIAPCGSELALCVTSCYTSVADCDNLKRNELSLGVTLLTTGTGLPGDLTITGTGCGEIIVIPNVATGDPGFFPIDITVPINDFGIGTPNSANVFRPYSPQNPNETVLQFFLDPSLFPNICDCSAFTISHANGATFDLRLINRDTCCDAACTENESGYFYTDIYIDPAQININTDFQVSILLWCGNGEDGFANDTIFGISAPSFFIDSFPIISNPTFEEWKKQLVKALNGPNGLPAFAPGTYVAMLGNTLRIKAPLSIIDGSTSCSCEGFFGFGLDIIPITP